MSTPERPALRYHGGKWLLAPWIIAHFPTHRVYVEPFGGGGSVLLRKPRSYTEVYNDKWSTVVNVFRVLRDPAKAADLRRAIELTPFARDEFVATYAEQGDSDVEAARKTVLRSFAGFASAAANSDFTTGFRANSNRSGTTPAHDWANYPRHIASFTERMRGVVIENKDAVAVIEQHDTPETLFYVDPPYLHETRNMQSSNTAYAHEMTERDHCELAMALNNICGMAVVSGYPSSLYDDLFTGWRRIEREALANGARSRIEVLWLNPRAASRVHTQAQLFEPAR